MTDVDNEEETLIADESVPSEGDALKEAWPIPPEDYVREFEQYLQDIGLRF